MANYHGRRNVAGRVTGTSFVFFTSGETFMNMFLAHGNVEWIVAGFVVFIGLMIFIFKIIRFKVLDVLVGSTIWYFVYSLHSGSTAGIMTATLAALLFDLLGMPLIRLVRAVSRH